MTDFNDMQTIKRRFFAMRNGVIADTMRRAGSPYKIVFGLNLPQIKEIAAATGVNHELAMKLWADVRCRESLITAPYIMDPAQLTADAIASMACESPSFEATDILCLAMIRHHPACNEVFGLLHSAASGGELMSTYALLRLAMNIADTGRLDSVRSIAAGLSERSDANAQLRRLALQVLQELEADEC